MWLQLLLLSEGHSDRLGEVNLRLLLSIRADATQLEWSSEPDDKDIYSISDVI